MRVCFVTSECVPYAKTGGLADVAGSLPKALSEAGCEVKVVMPLYSSIRTLDHKLDPSSDLGTMEVDMAGKKVSFTAWYGKLPDSDVDVHFIDCPAYYHRGELYTSDSDEAERFILLQHAAMTIMQRYHWSPDIVHCNDWHTALLPIFLRDHYSWDGLFNNTASVLTIHNIGYQGRFSPSTLQLAGLRSTGFYPGGPYELEGSFSFLKTGLLFADAITTVSDTYAKEIQTPAYGAGLEKVLRSRERDLYGVLNGIDLSVWHPSQDDHLERRYTYRSLGKKLENKRALIEEMRLPFDERVPVIGVVSRLTPQKGLELLEPIIGAVVSIPAQVVVLGSGESRYEDFFRYAASTYGESISFYPGYSERLAHRITAGSDMFLMPSHYEPCGMNQMFSLVYGTVPIVRKTGGLADTVFDYHEFGGEGNGFSFVDFESYALHDAIGRACSLFRNKDAWLTVQKRGMKEDFSWNRSASRYLDIYETAKSRH
jgi:starch synthase